MKIQENICDSIKCLNNGKCSESNGTCLCLTQQYFGDSCQYCNLNYFNNGHYFSHSHATKLNLPENLRFISIT